MKKIRTKGEFTCDKCDRDAVISIEFESHTYTLCKVHEQEFKEYIQEQHI